jgi:hypothetical protein
VLIATDDLERLDRLFGLALFNQHFHDRLLVERDEHLLEEFHVTEPVRRWIREIPASSLSELAQHIIASQDMHA